MKTHVVAVVCFIFNSFLGASYAQDYLSSRYDLNEVKTSLVLDQKWVPYPSYTDRSGWDSFLGENKNKVIKRGESKLNYKWALITATDYLAYERTGNRKLMEDAHTANQNAFSDLLLAELAEGKGRFLDQIIDGVFLQCERTSWVLSAHLPAQLSKRTLPEINDQVIDLGSARLSGLLAWTYYFLHEEFDKINPEISNRLYKELYDKMIIPYRNETRYWWMALSGNKGQLVNNWNPWCNFNALQCLFLLEKDAELLAQDVYKSMRSVDQFLNYIKSDGACEEGPSYWGHAAGKLYDYLRILSWGTGDHISIFDNPQLKKMGEYIPNSYVGEDWVVNFADASARFSADVALIYRYGSAVESEPMKRFASELIQGGKNSLTFGVDVFRALESLSFDSEIRTNNLPYKKAEVISYPETQFYYIKNKNLFLASKGGHNNESHNHNDVGTFSLYLNNTPLIIDVGVGTYTRQTFGPERYSIWTMRSIYHNLPTINGSEQVFGSEYRATDVNFSAKKKSLSLDITKAYAPTSNTTSWKRSYQLNSTALVITDEFEINSIISPNRVHFMLWGNVDITTPGVALIDVDGNKARLNYKASEFKAELETIELSDPRLSKVWGKYIYRLTLISQKPSLKGKYQYTITPFN